MGTNSEARKRAEALFAEPQWAPSEEACCEHHERVLRAARKVWPSSDLMEAAALADALEDEGIL